MQLPSETLLQGGKYRIIEKIGQGGFGITYKAEDTLLERIVAIKEFFFASNCERQASTNQVTFSANNSDLVTKLKRKFLNEAKRLAKFNHNSIVSIYDVFEENGTAYFSMEYIKSGSLDDLVRKSGKLSESEAMAYIQQLAEVLHYLHSRKTCHLDIKPANVLLDENGRIKLIDFGLSKQYDVNSSHTTTLLAVSKGYAPIEQYSQGGISDYSPTADIYSLGATLYFLLKGEAPPEAIQLVVCKLPKIKNVSDVTNAAILHAMKASSKERPQTVTEWLAGFDKPSLKSSRSAEKKKAALTTAEIVQPIEEKDILQTIAFFYDDVRDFSDGLAGVEQNGKWGFIDKTGKQVISFSFDYVSNFKEGLAYVLLNGKYGFIDKSGKQIIPIVYDNAQNFSEGLAWVEQNGEWGCIEISGKLVIPFIYDRVGNYSEGFACVAKNGEFVLVDKSGQKIITFIYEYVWSFYEGLAGASQNDKFGWINKFGEQIVPIVYEDSGSYFIDGLSWVKQNGKSGFINKKGQQLIPLIYDDACDFSEGLAGVQQNDKWGFIDIMGQQVISFLYDDVEKFSDGLARVKKKRKFGFIDKKGQQVIPFLYDDVAIFSEGLAGVKQNGKWGFIDKTGKGI